MIKRLGERDLKTKYGTFREVLYYDGQKESVMGEVAGGEDVLCRIHSHCVGAHIFNSVECDCRERHLALIESTPFKLAGDPQAVAYQKAGFRADARDYQSATQIIADLNIASIVLLANDESKADNLRRDGITVTRTRPLA
jgi:GTP cyclohydrolase II